MSDKTVDRFTEQIREMLGAAECMSFAGKTECLTALFEAFELGARDCVYVSALTSSRVVKAIMACGAVPMLCDVTPDSLTIDSRALETAVRQTIAAEQLYPRAVIADNFCGMPFALKAVKSVCDRMGLVFIENCGAYFGGTSDGVLCGTSADYTLLSLGSQSVFGTGGSGALAVSFGDSPLRDGISFCDGDEYQTVDPLYGEALLDALTRTEQTLERSRAAAKAIDDALLDSDFWLQHGANTRQKSSFGALAVVGQSEDHSARALAFLQNAGWGDFVRPLHVHRRACFDKGLRGSKDIENAAALAPRAFQLELFAALHAGRLDALPDVIAQMGRDIRE